MQTTIHRPSRRAVLRALAVAALALGGAVAGAMLAPGSTTHVGPLTVEVHVRPSLHPGVDVGLPPVGDVRFNTHDAPLAVKAGISSVDLDSAKELVSSPGALVALQLRAPDQLRAAALKAAGWTTACALLGGLLAGALGTRTVHGTTAVAITTVGMLVVVLGATALTFEPDRLAQPRFTGLLSRAPYVSSRTSTLAARLESYRSGLADFVQSVTTLYGVGEHLPTFPGSGEGNIVTVLHVSDIHLNPLGYDLTDRLVKQFKVDAVIDSGDTTTWGTPVESAFLSRIGRLGVPYVFVRGNHDSLATQAAVARQRGAVVLDNAVHPVAGLVLAGIGDPRFTPQEGEKEKQGKDQVAASVETLSGTVEKYDEAHPDQPVQVAIVHDPTRLEALRGKVPLILSGHLHKRSVRVDGGTRIMVEGSTGGAGITARGLARLGDGKPLPLDATLLYFVRSGPDAGRLIAYDEVTVGGLGLASVSVDRTVIRQDPQAGSRTRPTPSVTPSSTTTRTP